MHHASCRPSASSPCDGSPRGRSGGCVCTWRRPPNHRSRSAPSAIYRRATPPTISSAAAGMPRASGNAAAISARLKGAADQSYQQQPARQADAGRHHRHGFDDARAGHHARAHGAAVANAGQQARCSAAASTATAAASGRLTGAIHGQRGEWIVRATDAADVRTSRRSRLRTARDGGRRPAAGTPAARRRGRPRYACARR